MNARHHRSRTVTPVCPAGGQPHAAPPPPVCLARQSNAICEVHERGAARAADAALTRLSPPSPLSAALNSKMACAAEKLRSQVDKKERKGPPLQTVLPCVSRTLVSLSHILRLHPLNPADTSVCLYSRLLTAMDMS